MWDFFHKKVCYCAEVLPTKKAKISCPQRQRFRVHILYNDIHFTPLTDNMQLGKQLQFEVSSAYLTYPDPSQGHCIDTRGNGHQFCTAWKHLNFFLQHLFTLDARISTTVCWLVTDFHRQHLTFLTPQLSMQTFDWIPSRCILLPKCGQVDLPL